MSSLCLTAASVITPPPIIACSFTRGEGSINQAVGLCWWGGERRLFRPRPPLVWAVKESQAVNMDGDVAGEVWAFAGRQRRRRASGAFRDRCSRVREVAEPSARHSRAARGLSGAEGAAALPLIVGSGPPQPRDSVKCN